MEINIYSKTVVLKLYRLKLENNKGINLHKYYTQRCKYDFYQSVYIVNLKKQKQTKQNKKKKQKKKKKKKKKKNPKKLSIVSIIQT